MIKHVLNICRCNRGNFAVVGAVALVPILFAVGLAVDYTTLSDRRADMQQSLDSAALAIARAGNGISRERELEIATNFLGGNFDGAYTNLKIRRAGSAVTVSALINPRLAFSGLFGQEQRKLALSSTADNAAVNFEIALVLDTTSSMEGGKLTAMKNAVNQLVNKMSSSSRSLDRAKIGIVPFAGFVNVGPQFGAEYDNSGNLVRAAASWLDQDGNSPIPQSDLPQGLSRFALYDHLDANWPGCVETRLEFAGQDYGLDDTAPDPANPATLFVPSFSIDEPDDASEFPNSYLRDGGAGVGTSIPEVQMTRYGAPDDFSVDGTAKTANGKRKKAKRMNAGDDDKKRSKKAKKPKKAKRNGNNKTASLSDWERKPMDTSITTFYKGAISPKGPQFGCHPEALLPLTDDIGELKKKVGSLRAHGSTNTTEGVMWGWRILSPGEPFTQGAKKDSGTKKIMIVLADGTNVFGTLSNRLGSAYTSYGYLVDKRLAPAASGSSAITALMDKRTKQACTNAKNDGIEIYTIRLEENTRATGNMLRKCASSDAHYFDTPSRRQLDDVFEAIRDDIMQVRISS